MKFKVVLLKEGSGGIQTEDHYFDFGADMKGLAQDVARVVSGEDLVPAEDQPPAQYRLLSYRVPGIRWYDETQVAKSLKDGPGKRASRLDKCIFPNERRFFSELYKLVPAEGPKRQAQETDAPIWAKALNEERERQGVSMGQLAHVFGVTTQGAVSHYLLGRRPISVEQLINVSAALGMNPAPIIREAYTQAQERLLEQASRGNPGLQAEQKA